MKNKKIVIAGGSGFIGQALTNYFGVNNEIIILSRQLHHQKTNAFGENNLLPAALKNTRIVNWNGTGTGEWVAALNGAHLLINLAGQTVNCRYTSQNKAAILNSRIQSTRALGAAVQQCEQPPALWINAASATIYPHATDTPRDENFTEFGSDFSVQVCRQWEQCFFEQQTPNTRKVALRMAITLGAGGVMTPYFNLLKFGLGGRQGDGKQLYSWIHIEDTCRMVQWLCEHSEMTGVYNCVSPCAVTNAEFMKTLRQVTGTAIGLPVSKWMLKMGAALIGTEAELVLKSRWVLPVRVQQSGFKFKYAILAPALTEIVSKTPKKKYRLF